MRWRDDDKDNDYINNTNIPSLRVNADTYLDGPGMASTKKQRTTYGRRRFVIRAHPLDPAGDRAWRGRKGRIRSIRSAVYETKTFRARRHVCTAERLDSVGRTKKINFLKITLNCNEQKLKWENYSQKRLHFVGTITEFSVVFSSHEHIGGAFADQRTS